MDRRDLLKTAGGIGAVSVVSGCVGAEDQTDEEPRWVRWRNEQERASVSVDGHDLEVAYVDRGPRGERPVVCLHGIPTWGYIFRDVISGLAQQRRVLVPDMLGYGFSSMGEKRRDDGKVYGGFDRSLRAQEIMIDRFLENVGVGDRPVDLVAHDIGGGVFLRFAVHHPERVNKLVLTNTVQYDSWAVEPITDLGIPANIRDLSSEEFADTLKFIYQLGTTTDASGEFIPGNQYPWLERDAGKTSFARDAHATNTSHTTEIDPAEITAETLLLWGGEDQTQSLDPWAELLADDIPDSTLVPLEGANHWAMEDAPEEYRSQLDSFVL